MTTTETPPADPLELNSLFTTRLVRFRWWYFVPMILLVLIPFNGKWRIGLDSSLYRGVAENLVAGKGYTFAGLPQTQVYPGLPVSLAGIQKLTGTNSVVLPLILMNAIALATLWLTYQLICARYPRWIAIAATFGVAVNVKFAQQAQELMTDMPFLFGVVMAMLGWERLGTAITNKPRGRAIAMLIVGLFIAAVMRPTFWVLALALVITCAWNIIRYREKRSMIALASIVLVGILFAATDPRVRGMNILQGGYERELLSFKTQLLSRVIDNAPKLFNKEVSETFFNEPLGYFALPVAILLLGGSFLALRRDLLWGLQVFILTAVMMVLSEVPRYYVMVLPTLWVGYLLLLVRITAWLPPLRRDWTIFGLIGLANCMNFYGLASLAIEQHQSDFYRHYRTGAYMPFIKMAEVLKKEVPPDATVIGPHANVLTYFSGRNVLSGRLIGFDNAGSTRYPSLVEKMQPRYLVGPHTMYREKDPLMFSIIEHGVVVPTNFIASITDPRGNLWLTEATVVVPEGNWRKQAATRPFTLSERAQHVLAKKSLTAEQIASKELKAKRERKSLKAKRERKAIRLEREKRKQRISPATIPTSAPVSLRQSSHFAIGYNGLV